MRVSGVIWMSSRMPASTAPPPGRGLKKRREMVFVVPVVCATVGTAAGAAPVGAPGTIPVGRARPGTPPGTAPGAAVGDRGAAGAGAAIPAEIDCTTKVAMSLASAFRSGMIRSSLTALETVLSMRSIRPRISSRSAGAACTNTVLVLVSGVIRIWFWASVSFG